MGTIRARELLRAASPRVIGRIPVTRATAKNYQLKLEWKTWKEWLCGNRDETINHIISECGKLAQREYKVWHNWVGKVIHWELCKKFKFDRTNKYYMLNPEFVLENETHKILWDFEKQTNHLISARQSDLVIVNKKKKKKKRKKKEKIIRETAE